MSTGLVEETTQFIQDWNPMKEYHFEARYLDDLKEQMKRKFTVRQPFVPASKRVSVAIEDGPSMEIGIKKKIGQQEESLGVIFKKNLQRLDELRLLIQQIQDEEKRHKTILVILFGETDGEMKGKLESFLSMQESKVNIQIITK